ncbi:glycogen(starch) synthase [Amycolatopsis bartoniae]|uniref:Glycogen synthase n=1 Tax=Amycolatopsis bartoniae TaxID=941986 RepID=A0A8H9MFD3_9PSEU|nr:glycosyltransferase family 4 protein [Amycolatopsis bartoniae]MBB2936132.1 glycogen(starch) synthase [Amycolatopsis bartoniae]TVT07154.1 glycosyltransferase family 4 protein [Amycolatopsis bartoniae]GHF81329.1 glycogen synthase [Amycolatopsis bartoniae]
MRVLMLSWEYPPVVVGGLARHVHALARHLARDGHEVVVLCRHVAGTDAQTHPTTDRVVDGVRVIRVAEDPMHVTFEQDLVAWTLAMGHAMVRHGLELLRTWQPDVVHAHDWLVAHPAITLAETAGKALVGTIHATEAGRHSGWLSYPLNQQVHSAEWWLANRADALITCSRAMRAEVAGLFEVAADDISVIHNGIEERGWRVPPAAVAKARSVYAPDGAPLLLYFGRLEWEKGVQDLIAALPAIRRDHPGTRLVVAGRGRHLDELVAQARKLRVRRAVHFAGHLPDRELRAALAAADAVVLPSKYEPFGIVALEAAAAEAPLIASTAGGLGEVVIDGLTGLAFAPGDSAAIRAAVHSVLSDRKAARRRARTARARLAEDFDWARIAEATAEVYRRAKVREHEELPRPKIPTGNAFA